MSLESTGILPETYRTYLRLCCDYCLDFYYCLNSIFYNIKMLMNKETDNFMSKVRHALSLPIRTRCAELTVLFDRGSPLELQNFYPLLIENIFGPQGTISWCLRQATVIDEDFRQLHHFLSPCGPVFKLIYTLLKDPSAKYDFPLVYLPSKIQQILESGQFHPFYADLVHINPQTRRIISLLLNPFDYYMFHFAYYLTNPWHQRNITTLTSTTTTTTWNTVYYVLCCDYMIHFLPTDPNCPVLPIIYYNGKNPIQPFLSITNLRSPGSRLITTHQIDDFNTSGGLSQQQQQQHQQQTYGKHPRCEIWRSETVLTVFIDMWLNNDQVTQLDNQINNSFNTSQVPRSLQFGELPSGEYMRIIRVFIKQLHAFSSSAKIDDTHMCELKKIAIPMVQGKFYVFLRNLIHRWPLDGSFRLLLELWLTYIQPWRYPPDILQKTTMNKQQNNEDDIVNINNATKPIDQEYLPFIAENLLVYVVIFQQLLPRFTRVDLVSPKMSIMLYRITKVFNQSNLANFLQEIEHCVDNNNSPTHTLNLNNNNNNNNNWSLNLPPLNPTSNWCSNTLNNHRLMMKFNTTIVVPNRTATIGERKWSAIVRQKIYELEGPNFCYKSLFSQPPANEVYDLIVQIQKSIRIARELLEIKQHENELTKGFWAFIRSLWQIPTINDEFTLNERLKVPAYLETSLYNLIEIFQIVDIPEFIDTVTTPKTITNSIEMDDFKFLTPERVRQRIKQIKYEGDPDLLPIRSNEIKFLVRMFYQFAQYLNQQYNQKFQQWYYNSDYWARLTRQFLLPPMTIYQYDKTKPGSPRIGKDLPPRISFRNWANYNTLISIIIGGILARFIGYNTTIYLLFLLFVFFLYKLAKAIPNVQVRQNYPTQGFGNISFDDSF